MAKKKKEFTAFSAMTKKQKTLNFLKIFGLSFAGVVIMLASIVLYVWATGGFNPPYVPLETIAFSQAEYVIDGNKEIEIDENENQVKSQNGNVSWKQKTDNDGNDVYEYVMLIPNEGCTELDAKVKIDYYSNSNSPIIQLVEDENTKIINKDEEDADKLYYEYDVKIGSPIKIKPLTKIVEINGEQVESNIGGWVKLVATQGLITTSCWVYVDVPVLDYKIELNGEYSENEGVYNIYPNSKLTLSEIFSPSQEYLNETSRVPQKKGSTDFVDLNSRIVVYEVSNNEVISIDSNGKIVTDNDGNIVINENMENEEVTITSYAIAKYNDAIDIPVLDDFVGYQDPQVQLEKALQKIRIWSNSITLKINEISVSGFRQDGPKMSTTPSYNVFEEGIINFSNQVETVEKNSYFVDLVLTNGKDDNYKSTLLNKVELMVGYASESENDFNRESLKVNGQEIIINGKRVYDASNYVVLEKLTDRSYSYLINQFSQNKFYFIFTYTNEELNQGYYDYVQFALNKTDLNNIEITNQIINLEYNDANDHETYDLSNIEVTLTPDNSTYKKVMFFAPCDNGVIACEDTTLRVNIANKDCYPVSVMADEGYDYSQVVPIGKGRTNIYTVVMRTKQKLSETDSEFILGPNGYYEIERYAKDVIAVSVTGTVEITELTLNDQESNDIERINPALDEDDEDFSFAENCNYFVEVYRGGSTRFNISYQGTADALENNKLVISHLQGSNQLVASVANQDNTQDGNYEFEILANSVGYAKIQVVYDDKLVYIIGIKVLSTDLVGINNVFYEKTADTEIDTTKTYYIYSGGYEAVARPSQESLQSYFEQVVEHTLTVSFDIENNQVEDYSWNDLIINLEYNSPKTNAKNCVVQTYAVPENFDLDILKYYIGRDYNEIVPELDNDEYRSINTIAKFIKTLSVDESVIKIYNNEKQNFDCTIGGMIHVDESTYYYDFVGTGKTILFALSTATDICSNPVVIETKCPQISIMKGETDITNERQTKEEFSYGNFDSVEGYVSPAKQINLFGFGEDFVQFYVTIDNQQYGINKFVRFKFENQKVDEDVYISTSGSNAKITNSQNSSILTLANLSEDITENIIAYTNFGYVNNNYLQYNLKVNYQMINNTNEKVFETPSNVKLFVADIDNLPDIIFLNPEYDFANNYEYKRTNDASIYVGTSDSQVVAGKKYYSHYVVIDNPQLSDINNYFELTADGFIKTTDTQIEAAKTYYSYNMSVYVLVENPVDADLDKYYQVTNKTYYRYIQATDEYVVVEELNNNDILTYFEKYGKEGNRLYIPKAYNNLQYLFDNMPEEFVNSFYYADDSYSFAYYHIYPCITILSAEDYTVDRDEIILNYFETDDKINVYFRLNNNEENQNLYRTSARISVIPGIEPQFTYSSNQGNGYALKTNDSDDIANFDLVNQLNFVGNTDKYSAKITDVDFAVNASTSDDLIFVADENGNYVQTYVQKNLTEYDYSYSKLAEDYKEYYILTNDVQALTDGKTYYIKSQNNFVVVENPTMADIGLYYEKVYSNKVFYKLSTNYVALAQDQLNVNYISKYYEKIDDNYVLTLDKSIAFGKTYYVKSNYDIIQEGESLFDDNRIENIFDLSNIRLNLQTDADGYISSCKFVCDSNIQNISADIKIVLKVAIQITQNDSPDVSSEKVFSYIVIFE